MNLFNITVCITGGNKGLGREIVKILLKQCKKIIVIDRSEQILKHNKIEYIRIDLYKSLPEPREVDIFISNLGMSLGNKKFDDISENEIDQMLFINIKLQFWFYKNFIYKKFVFINSVTSFRGIENYSLYCSCKSFIKTFNQSLLREGSNTMIVYPYKINTQMFKEIKCLGVLEPDYVAARVIKGLENDSKEIYVPFIFRYCEFILGLLPMCVTNWILNFLLKK